ncbi:MAG TPA: antibiotic biosynthesis monooxygenase [Bryobacteraceae bacterium]|nr:antibiotic biosynthesis monooxygenase [Bryobacteraceae bacterium]
MYIVHVHVQVKPGTEQAFIDATLENARNSVQEAGVARFDVMRETADPTRFVLVEVYRDSGAPAKHRETAHYMKWRDAVENMMAAPRSRAIYDNLFPADEGW